MHAWVYVHAHDYKISMLELPEPDEPAELPDPEPRSLNTDPGVLGGVRMVRPLAS